MATTEKVLTVSKTALMQVILNHLEDEYTWFGMGTGTTAATAADTALETEVDIEYDAGITRKQFYKTHQDVPNGTLACYGDVQSTEGNTNDMAEYGEFDSDAGGADNIVARCTYTPFTKNEDVSIHVITTKTITITLN